MDSSISAYTNREHKLDCIEINEIKNPNNDDEDMRYFYNLCLA